MVRLCSFVSESTTGDGGRRMTTTRILAALATAAPGSPEMLDAIDAVNRADFAGGNNEFVEKADRLIAAWDRGERQKRIQTIRLWTGPRKHDTEDVA